jgi:hypothetical protein
MSRIGHGSPDRMKQLGEAWQCLSASEKQKYVELSQYHRAASVTVEDDNTGEAVDAVGLGAEGQDMAYVMILGLGLRSCEAGIRLQTFEHQHDRLGV